MAGQGTETIHRPPFEGMVWFLMASVQNRKNVFVACALAANAMEQVEIILARPAVEAGQPQFLARRPSGDKVDPYLRLHHTDDAIFEIVEARDGC